MLHKAVRLVAFYNRKERSFSHFEQFLAQLFAGFLALTAAAIFPRLYILPPGLYLVLAVLFAVWPIQVKLRQIQRQRLAVFTVREQKLTQLSAASLFLAAAAVFPQVRGLHFFAIVGLTVLFALRPVFLLYIKNERWVVRTVGVGLVTAYVVLAVTLHSVTASP
jgi:hypothetical protein